MTSDHFDGERFFNLEKVSAHGLALSPDKTKVGFS